jgi:purine-binding chemotaxis protein CheW
MSRRRRSAPLDWQEVHDRLARAREALTTTDALSPERARSLMEERARALARPTTGASAAAEILEVITFALGRERYAIETRFVREVIRLVDFTPVPGAPEFVLGVTHLRGEVLAIVDLRKFLRVAHRGVTDLSRVLVLGAGEPELGVLADAVEAIGPLPVTDALAAPETVAGIDGAFLRGVTRDALIVLDGGALLSDEGLFVDQSAATPGGP